jgi:hypothetical protein
MGGRDVLGIHARWELDQGLIPVAARVEAAA